MRKLVYDVAASIDGFIAGPGGDISAFLHEGDHVDAYFARLADYDACVMGRATYEFGYDWGIKPGERPYTHMRHVVVSKTLELPGDAVEVSGEPLRAVDALKAQAGGDIYLCGGGKLAGLLWRAGRIDRLIIKLNPIVLGQGVPIFEGPVGGRLRLAASHRHDSGVMLLTYEVDGVCIRAAEVSEIEAVRSIERTSATRFLGTDRAAIAADEPSDAETLGRRIAEGGLLVATIGEGEPVAFAMFRPDEGCAYVEQIDVLPSHEGLRLGALLLDAIAAAARARGLAALTLSTFADVPFNAPYYRRLGFTDVTELTPRMTQIRAEHEARGLDESRRVFMRRDL